MAFFRMPGSFGSGFLVGLGAATLVPLAARVLSGAGALAQGSHQRWNDSPRQIEGPVC